MGEPDTEPGSLGGHHRARIADRPGKLDADRTIIGRVRARGQPDLAVRCIAPLPSGDAQARRRQAKPGKADHTVGAVTHRARRSEEHTSELQSLMRISYAVFCLKKKNTKSDMI